MAMRSKVIGPISAYAIAVANGYTGTEAQFAEQASSLVESLPSDFTPE